MSASAAPAAAASPTIWDFLGIHQIGSAIHGISDGIHSLPIVQLAGETVLHPMLQATGLMPVPGLNSLKPPAGGAAGAAGAGGAAAGGGAAGGAAAGGGAAGAAAGGEPPVAGGEQTTEPPSAEELTGTLLAEQDAAKEKIKIEAIRFLGKQDCLCYPEIMDALLASLDDCSEIIRYEALRAIHGGCRSSHCATCQYPGSGSQTGVQPCKCQLKVIRRISRLLLDRNVNGQLKERSVRVRHLAQLILKDCLCAFQPSTTPPRPSAQPDPPIQLPLR